MGRFFWEGPKVSADVAKEGAQGVKVAAEFVLETANRTVPIEEAILQRSGTVSFDAAKARANVSYDTKYARRQHEDTRLQHDPGRRAKWLELTMREEARNITDYIGRRLKGAF